MWTALIWLSIVTSGALGKRAMKLLIFEYSSMAAEVVASEEGLLPIELVIT
jgi:hypothetical protein